MSRTRVLSVGGAILGTAVLISFTIGLAVMVREPGGESDLVTGTIASGRAAVGGVLAGPAEQPVAAGAAEQPVASRLTQDLIRSRAALDALVPRLRRDLAAC